MYLFVGFCLFSLDESERNLLGTESEKQEILIQAYITHDIYKWKKEEKIVKDYNLK